MLLVFVLDTEDQSFNFVETTGGLHEWYRLCHCDLIDIVPHQIEGKWFDVIADDEGLFKEDPIISAVNQSGKAQLVGSIVICNHDGEGNEASLTPEDQEIISRRQAIATGADGKSYRVIVFDD